MTEEDADRVLKAAEWRAADNGYFRGRRGSPPVSLQETEMPATMIRLNLVKGLGPVMQIAEGWTVNLPDEVSEILWKRTRLYLAVYLVRSPAAAEMPAVPLPPPMT